MAKKSKRPNGEDAIANPTTYATVEEAEAALAAREPEFESLASISAWRNNIAGSRPEDVE